MSWPVAFCQAEGEQELVDEIVTALQTYGALEVSVISSQFGQRFNEYVRMSPWSPYAAGKRNDGSFKRWLKDCGFAVGEVVNGNKAWVYPPQDWETWKDDWHVTAEKTAHVELASWGIGDAGLVDIFKKETCNVMQVPQIKSDTVHLLCLNLQENGLGDVGVEALVRCIVKSRIRIDILKLYKNPGITSKGASKLAELYAFECRPPPKEMHLSDCSICEKGTFDLLLAMAQRWRTAERKGGKAARPAYVRLDNNPLSMDTVQNKLNDFNFNVREAYDPRSRHQLQCQVHEIGGGPKLILLPHISMGSTSQWRSHEPNYDYDYSYGQGYGRYDWEAWEEQEENDEDSAQYVKPSESSYSKPQRDVLRVVQENPADPPSDVRALPIQCGCVVQYHDDPNWIGTVVGFDYKGTAIVDWHQGAKKGSRTTSGGKYLRIVEQATGSASSKELVVPKEQVKPSWEQPRFESASKDVDSQVVVPVTSQPDEGQVQRQNAGYLAEGEAPLASGPSRSKPSYQEPRDCRGVSLKKNDKVQYHDDSSWLGDVIGFSAKDNLTVVSWITGGKAGKRTFASGRFLRIVSRQVQSDGEVVAFFGSGSIQDEGPGGVIGQSSHTTGKPEPFWHGLSGLADPGESLTRGP